MNRRRQRLLIPPQGPTLTDEQLASLREHFEIVTGPEAETALRGGSQVASATRRVRDDDIVVRGAADPDRDEIARVGKSLFAFDARAIQQLNSAERLKQLEERIARAVGDLLHVEHFEVRLLNRQSQQLELVIAVGIRPLGVGQSLYARPEQNGISGYVACTGESYICPDAANDPRYLPGLENARSSLTVPLKLKSDVIGVFNLESARANAFSQRDRRVAEILAEHIALALHMLNLLVVERYSTRQKTAEMMADEIRGRLDAVLRHVEQIRAGADLDSAVKESLEGIVEAVEDARRGLGICRAGPKSLLGVERALRDGQVDARLADKTVVVVDDDAGIRQSIREVLAKSGCRVVACRTGAEALSTMRDSADRADAVNLVISDVKLPDFNGYEIFRSARELFTDVPVILMTGFGYDPHHSIVRASQEGLQCILFKPFKAEQLLEEAVRAMSTTNST